MVSVSPDVDREGLANIALSALDRRYAEDWQEMTSYASKTHYLRSKGHATYC